MVRINERTLVFKVSCMHVILVSHVIKFMYGCIHGLVDGDECHPRQVSNICYNVFVLSYRYCCLCTNKIVHIVHSMIQINSCNIYI